MNAAIRAIVRTAIASGLNVKGIMRGYAGLLNEEIIDMDKAERFRNYATRRYNSVYCQMQRIYD